MKAVKWTPSLLCFQAVAVNKLAAAHRGALRALQVIIQQLSDVSRSKVPPHCKELGQLLRQLSLCSAKVEVDQDSAGTALDILQKLEVRSINFSPESMFCGLNYYFFILTLFYKIINSFFGQDMLLKVHKRE